VVVVVAALAVVAVVATFAVVAVVFSVAFAVVAALAVPDFGSTPFVSITFAVVVLPVPRGDESPSSDASTSDSSISESSNVASSEATSPREEAVKNKPAFA